MGKPILRSARDLEMLEPIWNVSPDVRETHQETTESSGQQGNNAEFKEMLKQMREEM